MDVEETWKITGKAGKAKILHINCEKNFTASKIENHGLVCLTIKNIDETNLDDEFVSVVPIKRYGKFRKFWR